METYTVYLRYYIGDPLKTIRQEDLDAIADGHDVEISFTSIDRRTMEEGMPREETLNRPIEEITQDIITVASNHKEKFRKAVTEIYDNYRSPRTPYGFWGSSPEGGRIAREIANETGGGW